MSSVHAYRARCSWSGSTGEGYEQYRREHAGSAPPAGDSLLLSADPAFRGQAEHLNPEQLVVGTAHSPRGPLPRGAGWWPWLVVNRLSSPARQPASGVLSQHAVLSGARV